MTDDTTEDNVKKFKLNLVAPEDKDAELKDCLNKGLTLLNEIIAKPETKSFFAIVLDDTDDATLLGAGEQLTLKTIGALETAKNELLRTS